MEQTKNKKKKNKHKKETKIWKKILIILSILAMIGGVTIGFLLYGPYPKFRDWLITSAMTSPVQPPSTEVPTTFPVETEIHVTVTILAIIL